MKTTVILISSFSKTWTAPWAPYSVVLSCQAARFSWREPCDPTYTGSTPELMGSQAKNSEKY